MRVIKFDLKKAKGLLPRRHKTHNKTFGGKVLIIAGSRGILGAGVLSAAAAARVGAGYVTLLTDSKNFPSTKHPEFLIHDKKNKLSKTKYSAHAIGPGLGQSAESLRLLKKIIKVSLPNVVVDADALNLCAKNKLTDLPKNWILTPHEGELSRLLGVSADSIRADRKKAVRDAQKKFGCIVLLKGHHTLIATVEHIYEIQSGNVALAKAGTGDVLTGMITGFLAQGLSSSEAACLGAFIHGWMADQWVRQGKDYLSLLPTDLLEALPQSLFKLRAARR